MSSLMLPSISALAGFLHDLGKSSDAFQQRLKGKLIEANQVRHEWTSLLLWEHFIRKVMETAPVKNDTAWLDQLQKPYDHTLWLDDTELLTTPKYPMKDLISYPLANLLGWLIVSHHRLPTPHGNDIFSEKNMKFPWSNLTQTWNEEPPPLNKKTMGYYRFSKRIPMDALLWKEMGIHAGIIKQHYIELGLQSAHLARVSLMLADHQYSKLMGNDPRRVVLVKPAKLYANTTAGTLNQTLDEHLLGVGRGAHDLAQKLVSARSELPQLRSTELTQNSSGPFSWQNDCVRVTRGIKEQYPRNGAFMVNMASTGCGKTLANAKVMNAFNPDGLRCNFAMGLRTLTLQTSKAFKDKLSLKAHELCTLVGGAATQQLWEHHESKNDSCGSASATPLIPDPYNVLGAQPQNNHILLQDESLRHFLGAPLLVCTIDHLMSATDGVRGGRQIAPLLRLLTSDLVLDEPDDFDLSDIPALTRLVFFTGLMGSNVLISSATLPPSLVKNLYAAYRAGRAQSDCAHKNVSCLWFDEFTASATVCSLLEDFGLAHDDFVTNRVANLESMLKKRSYQILAVPPMGTSYEAAISEFAKQTAVSSQNLHAANHTVDPITQKKVSFGLVRIANIQSLVLLAKDLFMKSLFNDDYRVHICVYHSQYPALMRSALEKTLDTTLQRKESLAVFTRSDIRGLLDQGHEKNHIFLVVASPVAEVGRDHDYDWAIVEPSSKRSMIQIAGRVLRHRSGVPGQPDNMAFFNMNLNAYRMPVGKPVFCYPGFEDDKYLLSSRLLDQVLSNEASNDLTAAHRIVMPSSLSVTMGKQCQVYKFMSELEHAQMKKTVENYCSRLYTSEFKNAWYTGAFPKQKPFRDDDTKYSSMHLGLNQDESYVLYEMDEHNVVHNVTQKLSSPSLIFTSNVGPWATPSYADAVKALSQDFALPVEDICAKFGTIDLKSETKRWSFNEYLGFYKES